MDATGHITLEVVPLPPPGPNRCRGGSGRTGWDAVAPIIDDDSLARLAYFTTVPVQSKHGVPIKG